VEKRKKSLGFWEGGNERGEKKGGNSSLWGKGKDLEEDNEGRGGGGGEGAAIPTKLNPHYRPWGHQQRVGFGFSEKKVGVANGDKTLTFWGHFSKKKKRKKPA